jgi:hypothetical protein
MTKIAAVILIAAVALSGCGSNRAMSRQTARHDAVAAVSSIVVGGAAAVGKITHLLEEGAYEKAGEYAAQVAIQSIEKAIYPTTVSLRIDEETIKTALPGRAARAATRTIEKAYPRVSVMTLEASHRAELQKEAAQAEQVYPESVRKPFLRACAAYSTDTMCECALKHTEAHVPIAQVTPKELADRVRGWLAKCELEKEG